MKISKKVIRLGIDLGRNSFHLSGVGESGILSVKRKLSRKQLVTYLANISPCLVGMEACAGSHHWAREIGKLGHEVKLMSPQFVKPYVKSTKNDYNDAEGVCEAVSRPGMRFVSVKTVEQQDIQALHRMRQLVVKSRTAPANQIRGLLGEYGIVIAKGISQIRRRVPEILEDDDNGLSERFRGWLFQMWEDFVSMGQRIGLYDIQIGALYSADEACQRIGAIAGIGPQTATAIVSTFGDGKQFSHGRQFAASIGLVPRQHTTGGKPRLLGISKRGDKYIRTLLIQGARSVTGRVEGKTIRSLLLRNASREDIDFNIPSLPLMPRSSSMPQKSAAYSTRLADLCVFS
ncbi:MAG: IS110 family transposase [Gammaproteobacteria bacterium]|nr:IS110 family transposase [Gammaproteobacteria bacterium]